MKTNYSYITPFGDDLATVTGKSAARGRDSVHNLRLERREMLKRLAALRALAERRWQSMKGLLATVERLQAENARLQKAIEQAKTDCWFSLLFEENERLQAENAAFKEKLDATRRREMDMAKMAVQVSKRAYAFGREIDKLSRRLHDCRADRRKWRDTAERCFAAAMKNAVALADERTTTK